MSRWLPKILTRVRRLAAKGRVRFTLKALRELASLGLGLDPEDARDALARLRTQDSAGRVASEATGEWMYVFKPRIAGTIVYVKAILRDDCLIVSFHEDEGGGHENE